MGSPFESAAGEEIMILLIVERRKAFFNDCG